MYYTLWIFGNIPLRSYVDYYCCCSLLSDSNLFHVYEMMLIFWEAHFPAVLRGSVISAEKDVKFLHNTFYTVVNLLLFLVAFLHILQHPPLSIILISLYIPFFSPSSHTALSVHHFSLLSLLSLVLPIRHSTIFIPLSSTFPLSVCHRP